MKILERLKRWWKEKPHSIFRIVDRPTCFVKTEIRNGQTWLVTYIRCEICSKKTEECVFDYEKRIWKCLDCEKKEDE